MATTSHNITIKNSVFKNLNAKEGGAVYISLTETISLINLEIFNNTAL